MASYVKNIVWGTGLVAATTLVTSEVISQQDQDDMATMMQAWEKLAEPGEQHAEMAKLAGTWHQENTYWMYPGAEPTTSTSEATFKPIFGGRYMVEKLKGSTEFMGEVHELEGLGIFGYDNFKQKHVFAWIDNMGTMIMIGEGTADETGKVITYHSDVPDPMTGKMTKVKSISREVNDDKNIFEMHMPTEDGGWFKHMEIVATRTP